MQKIQHEYKNIHPIFDDIERFYTRVSEKNLSRALIPDTFDSSFTELQRLFNQYTIANYQFNFTRKNYKKLNLSKFNSKNIIVCFSGGKDSIAAVLHYQKLGYNVYLYHMRHINFALSDEWQVVKEFTEYQHLPLYIDEVTLSGHHDWVEHPMKNMIIANGALHYGIRENIGTKIAFGNYYTSSVFDDNFSFCGGDDIETWRAYETIIRRVIPRFRIYICLKNIRSAFNVVCSDRELLDKSVSCIGRANLRQHKRNWVKTKFGIELPKNRCGQCYKCCIEYIYMADKKLIEFNKEYYDYCLNKLRETMRQETGILYPIDEIRELYLL